MSKKVSKKVVKKETVKKPTATKKVKIINKEAKVELQSYEVSATIPTQEYGNIIPKIIVTAPSMEEAKKVVMTHIEELYKQYAVSPLGVRSPSLSGRSTVTAEEKKIEVTTNANTTDVNVSVPASEPEEEESEDDGFPANVQEKPRSEAFQKGAAAIAGASSHQALALVRSKIESSVKIDASDKPELLSMADVRYNEIPF